MKLGDRLQAIYELIPCRSLVADVGADHGYLSIALAVKKNCRVLMVDNKQKPLEQAISNVSYFKANDKITPLNSSGIKDVYNAEYIVIAGLGGQLISQLILDDKEKLVDSVLILQPNNDIEKVREIVSKIGYYISDERIIIDKNIIYEILICQKSVKGIIYDKHDLMFGPILRWRKEELFLRKWQDIHKKKQRIISNIEAENQQYHLIKEDIRMIEEVLNENANIN